MAETFRLLTEDGDSLVTEAGVHLCYDLIDFPWVPSHEYREEIGYDVDKTVYASGAQQRYLNNPDPIIHSFHLTFENRSNAEIQEIVDFLKERKGPFEAFYYLSRFDNTLYTVCLSGSIPPATQTSMLRKIKLVFEVVN